MKNLKISIKIKIMLITFFFAFNCNHTSPFYGPGEISGRNAKLLLNRAVSNNLLFQNLKYGQSICKEMVIDGTYASLSECQTAISLILRIYISYISPILTGVKTNKIYIKSTVNECIDKINLLSEFIAYPELTCNIEEVHFIQIGDKGFL